MTTETAQLRIFRISVRVAAAIAVFGVLAWLSGKALSPGGNLSVKTDLVRPAPFVSEPMPSDRVLFPETGAAGDRAEIIGDPVYLDFSPPAGFDEVEMAFNYRDGVQPDIRLGALVSSLDQSFDLRPAGNALLDALPWRRVSSGRFSVWSKDARYASFDEFLNNPPPRAELLALGRVPLTPYRLPGYRSSSAARTVTLSLRGTHRLLTYIKDEALQFNFSVQDMNRLAGADPVIVSVYPESYLGNLDREPEPLASATLEDDGNILDDQKQSGLRTVSVSALDLPEGAYVVEFSADNDVFIRSFATRQSKAVFDGRIYLGDHVGYSDSLASATVWAEGRHLTARTRHAEGIQTISVGGTELAVTELRVKAVAALPASGPVRVSVPRGDVLLETDGVLSLSRDSHFNPLPFAPDWTTGLDELERRGIKYAVADYETPETDGNSRMARLTFDLAALARTDEGAFRFVIDAPGIDLSGRSLPVGSVTFTLRRKPVSFGEAWSRFVSRYAAPISDGHQMRGAVTFTESPK